MESVSLLVTLNGLLSGVVRFLLEIALLVVALGPVHKHRPEASLLLAGAAGIALMTTILWYPATWFLPGNAAAYAVIGMFTTLLNAMSQVLLLLGILRLAVPVNRDPTRYG
jgi:hypothetical protein